MVAVVTATTNSPAAAALMGRDSGSHDARGADAHATHAAGRERI